MEALLASSNTGASRLFPDIFPDVSVVADDTETPVTAETVTATCPSNPDCPYPAEAKRRMNLDLYPFDAPSIISGCTAVKSEVSVVPCPLAVASIYASTMMGKKN